jgi:hypothetical protein
VLIQDFYSQPLDGCEAIKSPALARSFTQPLEGCEAIRSPALAAIGAPVTVEASSAEMKLIATDLILTMKSKKFFDIA